MIKRDVKQELAAAFAISFLSKNLQQIIERPTYQHWGKISHKESNWFEIIGIQWVGEHLEAVEVIKVEVDVVELGEAEGES